jgi:hypothetical protein
VPAGTSGGRVHTRRSVIGCLKQFVKDIARRGAGFMNFG